MTQQPYMCKDENQMLVLKWTVCCGSYKIPVMTNIILGSDPYSEIKSAINIHQSAHGITPTRNQSKMDHGLRLTAFVQVQLHFSKLQ